LLCGLNIKRKRENITALSTRDQRLVSGDCSLSTQGLGVGACSMW